MYKRSISLCLLAMTALGAYAQQEETQPEQLDEVVVTDSRFALKRENSGKTVITIDQEELQQNAGRSVAEIINTKSGIEINGSRSNAGQNISSFVRGGNNRQVLVIIDGVQVSDPSNVSAEFDLRLLSASQIESIEILKGAASTLYGNAAATAVINITTKKARNDGVQVVFESTIGTNQSQDDSNYSPADFSNAVNVFAKSGKWTGTVLAGQQYTDGLSAAIGEERDPFSKINGNVKLGYAFSENFNIEASAFYDRVNADFDNGFPVEDADFRSTTEQSRFGLSSTYNYGKGSVQLNAAYNTIDRGIESSFPSQFDSERWVIDVFNKYTFKDSFYTIVGVNVIDNKTFFAQEQNATTVDPYVNAVYASGFGLNINAGARLNNHSEYGTNLVYNLNPSYNFKLEEGYVKLLGSYSTSFIAPNLSQLFGPFGPNPELEPEENTTIEGGLEFRLSEKFRISALYFNRQEENTIQFVTIDFETFAAEYQNIADRLTANGVEVEVDATPLEHLNISANYTFTERKDELPLRLPKHKLNAVLGYDLSTKTTASLSYQFTSERLDTDFNTFQNVDLESFSLLNLYASHRLSDAVKIFAGIDNLFNEEYFEIVGFTTRGRNANVGFQLTL